jgi:hypothetical protein
MDQCLVIPYLGMPIVVEWPREMASLGSVLLRSGIGKIITLFSALEDRRGN